MYSYIYIKDRAELDRFLRFFNQTLPNIEEGFVESGRIYETFDKLIQSNYDLYVVVRHRENKWSLDCRTNGNRNSFANQPVFFNLQHFIDSNRNTFVLTNR